MKSPFTRFSVGASRVLALCVGSVALAFAPAAQSAPTPHPGPLSALCRKSRASSMAGADTGAYNMNAPLVPDPRLTPGAVLSVTVQDIAVPGYTKKVWNVPQAVKEEVYREYGITHREKGEYEIDHFISLELGGSNSIKNLWPQSYKTQPWNAHVKDQLENKLHG